MNELNDLKENAKKAAEAGHIAQNEINEILQRLEEETGLRVCGIDLTDVRTGSGSGSPKVTIRVEFSTGISADLLKRICALHGA